jgi:hypothetical protein
MRKDPQQRREEFNRTEPSAAEPQPMDEEEYSPQRRRGKRGFVKAFPLRVSAVNSKFFFAKNLRGPDNFGFGKTQIGNAIWHDRTKGEK